MSSTAVPRVVPAQLSFLAVYNPSLGRSDEEFDQQIVFYYARAAKARAQLSHGDKKAARDLREQENEKLRQVGLAQGVVGFARSFSHGAPVDSVETEKSRIVLKELEDGWWILASIDFTQLPAASTSADSTTPAVEYSSREVSPPALLIQQLVRAHSIFTLHHGFPLAQLLKRYGRPKFCNLMDKYWSRFASSWDVMLHASPAVDMYRGLKLAAGGELGMGVGEEEWGSSERDVLEDFARRTEGLVEVMVSRFGEPSPAQRPNSSTESTALDKDPPDPWLGSGRYPTASDGVVFSGMGALSRSSLRDLSHWVESMYYYGELAYGVRDNPASDRRKHRGKNLQHETESPHPAPLSTKSVTDITPPPTTANQDQAMPPGIPPPIVRAVESSLDKASSAVESNKTPGGVPPQHGSGQLLGSLGDTDTWVKYMTLGYGTAWGGKKQDDTQTSASAQAVPPAAEPANVRVSSPPPLRHVEPEIHVDVTEEKRKLQVQYENDGCFLVGLKGDMAELTFDDDNDEGNWNARIPLRTVYVEEIGQPSTGSDSTPEHEREMSLRSAQKLEKARLRPVVYVVSLHAVTLNYGTRLTSIQHRPFIYTFLFRQRTESLSIASFYRNIHNFFSPLHRTLERSTNPDKVAARLMAAYNPHTTTSFTSGTGPNTQPIYDLVYDPRTLTVHSSLPDVPDPGTLIAEGLSSSKSNAQGWSRVEALNVHSQILATLAATSKNLSEIERTCKTSRGWWVVWMRLPPSQVDSAEESTTADESNTSSREFNTNELREAFLVRRARDSPAPTAKSSGSRFASGMWAMGMGSGGHDKRMGGATAGWGPKGLAEGIGIDARRYVDELLSLNR